MVVFVPVPDRHRHRARHYTSYLPNLGHRLIARRARSLARSLRSPHKLRANSFRQCAAFWTDGSRMDAEGREEAEVGFIPALTAIPSRIALSHYFNIQNRHSLDRPETDRQTTAEEAGRRAGGQAASSLSIRVRSLPHIGPRARRTRWTRERQFQRHL